jgi:hypothetical protein
MTQSTLDTGPSQPPRAPIPLAAIIGIAVLALVGGIMLGFAFFSLLNPGSQPTTVAQVTLTATRAILIPTVTSAPQIVPTTAPAATDTSAPPPPTETPAGPLPTDTPSGPVLTIIIPANVRSGPGVNYPVIGGLQSGSTPAAVGRDSSATWYVVEYQGGRGWVSNQVAQYSGDANALPVVTAPPPPPTATPVPPTATGVPPTNTPGAGTSPNGVRGDFFVLKSSAREYGINQDIWFSFKITNTSNNTIAYRCLGAKVPGGPAQCSWGNNATDALGPHQEITWEDHINIGTAGTYSLVLGICYLGDTGSCKNSPTNGWAYLSPGIQITVK